MKALRTLLTSVVASLLILPSAFALGGDLSISDADVNFDRSYFLEGQTAQITAVTHNNSSLDLLGSVQFTANGASISSDQPISALAGDTDTVFIFWTPSVPGAYDIVVNVVPWDPDGDDAGNNTVTKSIYVDVDTDRDGIADSVDEDDDGDGVPDSEDVFPLDPSECCDSDGDGIGDQADDDDDNDDILDLDDDLPLDPLYSEDLDGDGIPDELDEDIDGEGLLNSDETEIGTDPYNWDTDGDTVDDLNDPFPLDAERWADLDGDGLDDSEDDDIDGDGIFNNDDIAPRDKSPEASPDRLIYMTGMDEDVIFDASSSEDGDGEIVQYLWTFEGEELEGQQISKSFEDKGVYLATLTVTDDAGQSDSVEIKIRVLDYKFLTWAIFFALLLISLAFYLIYRYNRRAQDQKVAEKANKKPVKSKKKTSKKKK